MRLKRVAGPLAMSLGLAGLLSGNVEAGDTVGDTAAPVQIMRDISPLVDYEGPIVFLIYSSRTGTPNAQRKSDMIKTLFDYVDDHDQLAVSDEGKEIRYAVLDMRDFIDEGWNVRQTFDYVRDTFNLPEGENGPFTLLYGPGEGPLIDREVDRLVGSPDNFDAMKVWKKKMTAWVGSKIVNPENDTLYCFENCEPNFTGQEVYDFSK